MNRALEEQNIISVAWLSENTQFPWHDYPKLLFGGGHNYPFTPGLPKAYIDVPNIKRSFTIEGFLDGFFTLIALKQPGFLMRQLMEGSVLTLQGLYWSILTIEGVDMERKGPQPSNVPFLGSGNIAWSRPIGLQTHSRRSKDPRTGKRRWQWGFPLL